MRRTTGRRWRPARRCGILSLLLLCRWAPGAVAQNPVETSDGSTLAAAGGAVLGAYSGAVLGTIGSLMPCTRTYEGPDCVRPIAISGGLVGALSGAAIGAADADRLGDRFVAGMFGAAAGSATMLALQPFLERWSWGDVGAGAVIGGAVASSGRGALIGVGVGAVAGLAAWQLIPSVDETGVLYATLLGLAAGGIGSWVWQAVDAQDSAGGAPGAQPAVLGFTIRTR